MSQHRPCAVIETPGIIELQNQRTEKLLHSSGQRGVARRRVLHLVKFWRKTTEVMNGARRSRDVTAVSGTYQ